MKKKSLLLSFVCVACCCIAQTISIPYDATSISDKYRNSNPDYVMYPASLDGKDSIEMTCDLNISSCIEAVDLGLSVKWATCNIGAASPTWNGQYFAWGEICPKERYNWDTYKLKTKYSPNFDDKTELEPCDDVATDFWGDEWRLPTKEEFEELCDFLREQKIPRAGVFQFSPEEGTLAEKMDNQVDPEIAQRRVELVVDLQSRVMDEYNENCLGRVMEVLCEGFDANEGCYVGRTYADSVDIDGRVLFTAAGMIPAGEFVNVRITGVADGDLTGEIEE